MDRNIIFAFIFFLVNKVSNINRIHIVRFDQDEVCVKKVLFIVKSDFQSMNFRYPLIWNLYAILDFFLLQKISYIYKIY